MAEDCPTSYICAKISASAGEMDTLNRLVREYLDGDDREYDPEDLTDLVCRLFVENVDKFSTNVVTNFVKNFSIRDEFGWIDLNHICTRTCPLFIHATKIGDIPLLDAILDVDPKKKDRFLDKIFMDVCFYGAKAAVEYYADLIRSRSKTTIPGSPRYADQLFLMTKRFPSDGDEHRDRVAIAVMYVDATGIKITDLEPDAVAMVEKYRENDHRT